MSTEFNWPIYGHKQQINFLQSSLAEGQLANAYLFYGPRGLGKKLIVRYFAQSLFCQSDQGRPCEQCRGCKLTAQGSYPDFYLFGQAGEDFSVDSLKNFLSRLSLAPVMGGQKLAIIQQAQKLNLYGFNSLLKILEEPPAKTTIILVADQLNEIPATVISRCQLLKFRPLNRKEMLDWLSNFKFSLEEKETVANLSFGKPGLALEFIDDQLKSFKQKCDFILKLFTTDEFSGLQQLDHWFAELKKERPAFKVYELGELTVGHLNLLELWLRDLLWTGLGRQPANSLYSAQIKKISANYALPSLLKNLLMLNKFRNKITNNVSPQLLWENLILSIKN